MEKKDTLSRNALYAVLNDNADGEERESGSLASFLSRASFHNHRCQLTISKPRNNGGRPVDKSAVSLRISQKALTLLNGRFVTQVLSRKREATGKPKSRRLRKRVNPKGCFRSLRSHEPESMQHLNIACLGKLNIRWNGYIATLWSTFKTKVESDKGTSSLELLFAKMFQMLPVDLVGSWVSVVRGETSLDGILVVASKRMWVVASTKDGKLAGIGHFLDSDEEGTKVPTKSALPQVKLHSLPKEHAELRLILPASVLDSACQGHSLSHTTGEHIQVSIKD